MTIILGVWGKSCNFAGAMVSRWPKSRLHRGFKRESGESPEQYPLLYVPHTQPRATKPLERGGTSQKTCHSHHPIEACGTMGLSCSYHHCGITPARPLYGSRRRHSDIFPSRILSRCADGIFSEYSPTIATICLHERLSFSLFFPL